jgi:hypothetical protein
MFFVYIITSTLEHTENKRNDRINQLLVYCKCCCFFSASFFSYLVECRSDEATYAYSRTLAILFVCFQHSFSFQTNLKLTWKVPLYLLSRTRRGRNNKKMQQRLNLLFMCTILIFTFTFNMCNLILFFLICILSI